MELTRVEIPHVRRPIEDDTPFSPQRVEEVADHDTTIVESRSYHTITAKSAYFKFSAEEIRLCFYEDARLDEPTALTKSTSRVLAHRPKLVPSEILTSDLIVVTVGEGDEAKTFNVHEAALHQSPALAAAVEPGKWIESKTRALNLPDDDPFVFTRLLDYFYSGKFEDLSFAPSVKEQDDAAMALVGLYCLADKYLVTDLKPKIAQKLRTIEPTGETFLDMVLFAYELLPDRDSFCTFKLWAKEYMWANYDLLVELGILEKIISQGGVLAWDCYTANHPRRSYWIVD